MFDASLSRVIHPQEFQSFDFVTGRNDINDTQKSLHFFARVDYIQSQMQLVRRE